MAVGVTPQYFKRCFIYCLLAYSSVSAADLSPSSKRYDRGRIVRCPEFDAADPRSCATARAVVRQLCSALPPLPLRRLAGSSGRGVHIYCPVGLGAEPPLERRLFLIGDHQHLTDTSLSTLQPKAAARDQAFVAQLPASDRSSTMSGTCPLGCRTLNFLPIDDVRVRIDDPVQ